MSPVHTGNSQIALSLATVTGPRKQYHGSKHCYNAMSATHPDNGCWHKHERLTIYLSYQWIDLQVSGSMLNKGKVQL